MSYINVGELEMNNKKENLRDVLEMAIAALNSCDINIGYDGVSQYYDEKLVIKALNAYERLLKNE